MTVAVPLSTYISDGAAIASTDRASYFYEGYCPKTGERLRLPRSPLAEAVARQVMAELNRHPIYPQDGKMYGILLVISPAGEPQVLRAVSGLGPTPPGWVPSLPARQTLAQREADTLAQLATLKQQLQTLATLPLRQQYADLQRRCQQERQQLRDRHRHRQQQRQRQRDQLQPHHPDTALALAALEDDSRRDGRELRQLKQAHQQHLQPLAAAVAAADAQQQQIKQARKALSQQLQADLHQAYQLTNFAGEWRSLPDLHPQLPSGTGDCCAPKLLYYAATHHLIPIAMAEFWWGPPLGDRQPGDFYPACTERCQPLMGFMLSGLSQAVAQRSLPIVYEDDVLVVVDKPAGLLSVPGRQVAGQDSVLTRLRPAYSFLSAVHRLDQDTSGLMVLAKTHDGERALRQSFATRQVRKTYIALLDGVVDPDQGLISLPLRPDPDQPPRQQGHAQGKPSQTYYRILHRHPDRRSCRVEFQPITGRTHQLRVHAAQGLGCPIRGDRLYGTPADRLYLHAQRLQVPHPDDQRPLDLTAAPLF
jgi:tRNA pseudouridine32 synthase/23S rRNA pseudouridine746 synthase